MPQYNKLRLLITRDCRRKCPGCCNKDWNLDALPDVSDRSSTFFEQFDEVLLTGGEPLLYPGLVIYVSHLLRQKGFGGRLYLYTALPNSESALAVLDILDGICVTLHKTSDIFTFTELCKLLEYKPKLRTRLNKRLNVFENVDRHLLKHLDLGDWNPKWNMEWIDNCPLPDGEMFARWGDV